MTQPYSVCHRLYCLASSHGFIKHLVLIVSLNEIMRHSLHHLMQVPTVRRKHERLYLRMMHKISEAFHVMLNFQRRYSKIANLVCLAMLHRRNAKLVVLFYGRSGVDFYACACKLAHILTMVSLSVLVAYQHTTSTTSFKVSNLFELSQMATSFNKKLVAIFRFEQIAVGPTPTIDDYYFHLYISI